MIYDSDNKMFSLAVELVNQSSRNIFLTGKAGTGKTTFLKYIRESCPKQMAVVAPTGVAAINAGGVTMHSFFQLPLSPFIPDSGGFRKDNDTVTTRSNLLSRLRMTTEKKKILQELELLVIDEISMVRCDMLDAVDVVLRHIRRRQYEKFGGVQVLMIGDLWQLPPVTKEAEWNLLKEFYNSPYFFDSHVIKDEPPLFIEFNKIYRQSEEKFIKLLNQVRNNELDEEGQQLLEGRLQPTFRRAKGDGYIILTTHNEKARNTNLNELAQLDKQVFSYRAEISGDFPESSYPVEEILQLKVGAQVMFTRNDSEKVKRYFNGKIGTVIELEDEKIVVQCNDDPEPIEVGKEKWGNIRYTLNNTTRQLDQEELGSFVQYPLKLAWAITIHKSQGLTFEKLIIDADAAFAPGQVYVALSRCTSLEGIVLKSRIRSNGLFTDERIAQFSKQTASANLLEQERERSKKEYQLKTLLSLFDYKTVTAEINDAKKYINEHEDSFNQEGIKWLNELLVLIGEVQVTAEKFQNQLKRIFANEDKPEKNIVLQERINAGSIYFINEQNKLIETLQKCPAVTDSRIHAKELNESLKEIFVQLSMKKHMLDGFSGRFEMEAYHKRKKNFITPPLTINTYAGVAKQKIESPHPKLYQQLKKKRDEICSKRDLPIYIVAGSTTLDEMSRYLPQTLAELRKVSGFGDAKIEKYGQQFLDIIVEYCLANQLSSLIHEKDPKRERKQKSGEKKVDTKAETYKLFCEGKSIQEIAKERSLTVQTIEGHLAHYVEAGEIEIEKLVSRERIDSITKAAKDGNERSLAILKEKLGQGFGFGEIKLVLAGLAFKNGSSGEKDS